MIQRRIVTNETAAKIIRGVISHSVAINTLLTPLIVWELHERFSHVKSRDLEWMKNAARAK